MSVDTRRRPSLGLVGFNFHQKLEILAAVARGEWHHHRRILILRVVSWSLNWWAAKGGDFELVDHSYVLWCGALASFIAWGGLLLEEENRLLRPWSWCCFVLLVWVLVLGAVGGGFSVYPKWPENCPYISYYTQALPVYLWFLPTSYLRTYWDVTWQLKLNIEG